MNRWPIRRPSGRERGRPRSAAPTPEELNLRSLRVRVLPNGSGTDIVMSGSDARRFATALHLGGAWGKDVTLAGPDGFVKITPFAGDPRSDKAYFGPERMIGSTGEIVIKLSLGRMEKLSRKFGEEAAQFTYPWFARWVVVPDLR